jgi:hypothetical protein
MSLRNALLITAAAIAMLAATVPLAMRESTEPAVATPATSPTESTALPTQAHAGSEAQGVAADTGSGTDAPGRDRFTEQELDAYAARFAAEPALIDALEDAGSPDPQVRADAEQLLSTLSVDEPDSAQPRP